MEKVAEIIRNQNVPVQQLIRGDDDITYLGSALLSMLLAFDKLIVSGKEPSDAIQILKKQPYPAAMLEGLNVVVSADNKRESVSLPFGMLSPDMVLAEDLLSRDGSVVISKGSELSANRIRLLNKFATHGNCLSNSLMVWKPA